MSRVSWMLVVGLLAGPVQAQVYAPANNLPQASQLVVDRCLAPPEGAGPGSIGCRRQCAANPQSSPQCAATAAASPGRAQTYAPAMAPQSSSTLPPPPSAPPAPGSAAGFAGAASNCDQRLALGEEPSLQSVNGLVRGYQFEPGHHVSIRGCGFGDRDGLVTINGTSGGLPNVPLIISRWTPDSIEAMVDPQLSAVQDQASVWVTVTPRGGTPLAQSGHGFRAAREIVRLAWIPESTLQLGVYSFETLRSSPGEEGSTIEMAKSYKIEDLYNHSEENEGLVGRHIEFLKADQDILKLSRLPLKNGYVWSRVELKRVGRTESGSDDKRRWFPVAPLSWNWKSDDVVIRTGWIVEVTFARGRYTDARTHYGVDLYVIGPRGLPPL